MGIEKGVQFKQKITNMSSFPGDGSSEQFPVVKSTWTDAQRRTVWTLICKSRIGLKLELSPIIATAFIILQKYFQNTDECPYKLFILMSAALFASCKAAQSYRPIEMIYKELSRICRSAPPSLVRSLAGTDMIGEQDITNEELEEITRAELDLLQSIDFDVNFELPFQHFERWKENLQSKIPNENFIKICNQVIIDICLVLCSKFYLELPPEVAAAAATKETLSNFIITDETAEWFDDVRQKYGEHVFNLAIRSITMEKQKTYQGPRRPKHRPPPPGPQGPPPPAPPQNV